MSNRNEKLGRLRLSTLDSITRAAYEREMAAAQEKAAEREQQALRAARKKKKHAARLRRLALKEPALGHHDRNASERPATRGGTAECARCRRLLVFTPGAVCDSCYDRYGAPA